MASKEFSHHTKLKSTWGRAQGIFKISADMSYSINLSIPSFMRWDKSPFPFEALHFLQWQNCKCIMIHTDIQIYRQIFTYLQFCKVLKGSPVLIFELELSIMVLTQKSKIMIQTTLQYHGTYASYVLWPCQCREGWYNGKIWENTKSITVQITV